MEKQGSAWKAGAFFVCEKCGRRADGRFGKDYAEDVKKRFKGKLKDEGRGKDIRVATASCLSLCPKDEQVVAWCPTNGAMEMIVYDPRKEEDQVFDWLKKK